MGLTNVDANCGAYDANAASGHMIYSRVAIIGLPDHAK